MRTGATCGSIGLRTARARPQPAAPTDRERGLGEAACPSAGLSGFVSMCVCIKESVTSHLMRRSGNRCRSAPGAATAGAAQSRVWHPRPRSAPGAATCWSRSAPGLASPATAQGRLTHVLSGPSPKPCCRAPCSFDGEARGSPALSQRRGPESLARRLSSRPEGQAGRCPLRYVAASRHLLTEAVTTLLWVAPDVFLWHRT